jgi:polar amino acid transport system substrate-binding protein
MILKKLLLLFLLLVTSLNAQSNEKVTLYLDWLNQFQFAGYYMAKEKSYYNAVGLDIDIKEFNSNSNVLKEVMENEATYGVGK